MCKVPTEGHVHWEQVAYYMPDIIHRYRDYRALFCKIRNNLSFHLISLSTYVMKGLVYISTEKKICVDAQMHNKYFLKAIRVAVSVFQ